MKYDIEQMISRLIAIGLTESEAVELIGIKIKNNVNMLGCGADSIYELLSNNVFEEDFLPQYQKMVEAGLSKDEAINVFHSRFCLWLGEFMIDRNIKAIELKRKH